MTHRTRVVPVWQSSPFNPLTESIRKKRTVSLGSFLNVSAAAATDATTPAKTQHD